MELYQLRSFVAVAEEGSVTEAAKRLHTTPPPVSVHIKTLEEEFGVSLFGRTAKGMVMVLTPRGERLLIKAQRVLYATRDLLNHATALQDYLMGTLTVGVNAAPDFLRIPGALNCFQSEAPGIDIDLMTSSTGHILQALQSKSLSAGFVFGPVPTDSSITTHFLDTVSLSVAAPAMWENRVTGADWPELGPAAMDRRWSGLPVSSCYR